MSRKRDREERIDLSRRLGITPPGEDEAGAGRPAAGGSGDESPDGAAVREDPVASEAVRETVSLRRAQRAHRRRRRLFALLIALLVVLLLAALGVVLWLTGLVGGA